MAHASKVVAPGRTFLRRMINVAHSQQNLEHWIRLSQDFKSDLFWWHHFLEQWNGMSLLASHIHRPPDVTLFTDASGTWGCGGTDGVHWFQCAWEDSWQEVNIATKELVPIILRWQNSHLLARSDNMAVVEILRSRTSRDSTIMHLLRCLHMFCAKHDIRISSTHIPGVENVPLTPCPATALPPFLCFFSIGTGSTNQDPDAALGHGGSNETRLAVDRLEAQVKQFLQRGIAPSTEKAYLSAQRGFVAFCQQLNLTPLPASEDTLILYVTDRAQTCAHTTIRAYLAGVRHMHIVNGFANPLEGRLRLNLVLKGIRREKPLKSHPRLSVTPLILGIIRGTLEQTPRYQSSMLWAACCLGFFGFPRSGEFTIPSPGPPDTTQPSTCLAVDSHSNPSILSVRIKASKTDQFGRGSSILYLGRTTSGICPVQAVLQYLAVRPPGDGPLFISAEGSPLTKEQFMAKVRDTLSRAGVDSRAYKGHSFRIGAATTAAACGLDGAVIKVLGRWSSSAYETHIKLPPSDVANYSSVLARDV
jgi:hypothetical protein